MVMELRRATEHDWLAAREVRLQSLKQDPNAFCATLKDARRVTEQVWSERLDEGITVLAWDGEVPIATVTGKNDPHEVGGREIVALWVDPSHRGTGLADALIRSVIDWARSEGAHEIALWVAEDNDHALALYLRCGFLATEEREAMRPGVDQIRLRMGLTQSALS